MQKISQARIYNYNAKTQKNQSIKHTNNRVHTYERSPKNAKIQQCKQLLHWFGNCRTINNSKNSEENPTLTKHSYKTIAHAQSCNTQSKVHQHLSQTWPTATAAFLTNYEFVTVTQSNFLNKTFDQSDSIFSTRKNKWSYTLSDGSMFTIFVRIKYWKF